jgi:CheY-like chemotaxis protein
MLPVLAGLGFLAVGVGVTVVAASQIWHHTHEARQKAFELEVDEVTHDVSDQIDDAAAILAGLDGLFASGEVGRAEFNNYIGKLESTPGFDAMRATSYIRLVTRDEVSRFDAEDINLSGYSRTVVVAEDNGINLSMMTDLLETSGWQVVKAENGADAVRLTGAHNPDLVLMDIQMPVMDGLAATRLLKADPATASIPVLAVTALAMPNDQERCFEAGCQGYLAKPFTPADFERAVLKTLSQAEPARI